MNSDTTPGRLYWVLEALSQYHPDTAGISALSSIFNEPHDYVLAWGWAEIIALPSQVAAELAMREFSLAIFGPALDEIELALEAWWPNERCGDLSDRISPESMESLLAADRELSSDAPTATSPDSLDDLLVELVGLQQDVLSANLPWPVTKFLLRQLTSMYRAITFHRVVGTDGIVDEVHRLIGSLLTEGSVLAQQTQGDEDSSSMLQRLADIAARLGRLVEVTAAGIAIGVSAGWLKLPGQ